jgi:hypothetical protein
MAGGDNRLECNRTPYHHFLPEHRPFLLDACSRLCASLLHFSGFIVIDRLKSIGGLKSSEKIFNAAVAKAKLMKILE